MEDLGLLDFPGDSSSLPRSGLRAEMVGILRKQQEAHGSHDWMKDYTKFDLILEHLSE